MISFRTICSVILTIFAMVFIWQAAVLSGYQWIYVLFGVGLMLWPCQWSYELGKKSRK